MVSDGQDKTEGESSNSMYTVLVLVDHYGNYIY